jgi:hypothetical protein
MELDQGCQTGGMRAYSAHESILPSLEHVLMLSSYLKVGGKSCQKILQTVLANILRNFAFYFPHYIYVWNQYDFVTVCITDKTSKHLVLICNYCRPSNTKPFKAQWLLHVPPALKPCILPTECVCVFRVVLTINSDCFPKQH